MTTYFRMLGRYMMMAARAHARWEIETANTILGDKKRIFILFLLVIPIFAVTVALAGP
ncbi:MAG: sulfite exporter TauE/SafE family protein, partial [Deltaproteobacteria bacterium]|nr:sulfite exporter TauE/SafE family protein [Deltaproteobacteria bacterium]